MTLLVTMGWVMILSWSIMISLPQTTSQVGDLREPLTDEQIMKGRTWDVQLALALLDATVGTGLAGTMLIWKLLIKLLRIDLKKTRSVFLTIYHHYLSNYWFICLTRGFMGSICNWASEAGDSDTSTLLQFHRNLESAAMQEHEEKRSKADQWFGMKISMRRNN